MKNIFKLILLALFIQTSFSNNWKPPEILIGSWSGDEIIKIRTNENGKYIFIKSSDSIKFNFTISEDGKVTGTIGNAILSGCNIYKNRNWLEKKLNLATDYVIRGELKGKIFENDPNELKQISIPFNIINFKTEGTLFQLEGLFNFNLFPVSDFNLVKTVD